jgi:hypothetical protein
MKNEPIYLSKLCKMNVSLMKENKPTAINTDVVIAVDSLNFGNQKFIPKEEASAFLSNPKTPERPAKVPVCPGAPARKSNKF